jgi:ABC-2 type transport system permease protein
LASPSPRAALVLGKGISAGARALSQVAIVYGLALLLGVKINWHPVAPVGVISIAILGASCFSTLSLILACVVKTRERFMGIGQVLTMPLFFASNAIYPISLMPDWLKVISHLNPLTYEVDALRALMLTEGTSVFGGFYSRLSHNSAHLHDHCEYRCFHIAHAGPRGSSYR